jgi:hypothetical protein
VIVEGGSRGYGRPVYSCRRRNARKRLLARLERHKNRLVRNYRRNLMALTGVPTMTLVWVTELFSFVPMKKPLAR